MLRRLLKKLGIPNTGQASLHPGSEPVMKQDIYLTLKRGLGELYEGRKVTSRSVGPAGECVMLLVKPADTSEFLGYYVSKVGSIPRSQAEQPCNGVILVVTDSQVQRIEITNLSIAHPLLQPLPDGNVLLVGARCRRFPDGTAESNAQIYSPDGKLVREMTFGDGIADVQATPSGAIWVSYFDEGIFGNYGWGNDASSLPIGASGLVQFDAQGNKVMEYLPPDGFDEMADCYAMNVCGEDVWAYYYTEFQIVHITARHQVRGWKTAIAGARALATDGRRVLFYGGYRPHLDRCVLGELGELELTHIVECRLVLPSGEACTGAQVIGRGPLMHVFTETDWYQVDVRGLQ